MPRNNHNGATRAVADLLDRRGIMTVTEICEALLLPRKTVSNAIQLMIARVGGAVRCGKRGHEVLYGRPGRDEIDPSARKPLNLTPPRYLAPFVPLQRDPFAHRTLALLGR